MEFVIILIWVILCFAIGNWSQSKGNGFASGFFLSLLLSPLIGLIIVGVSKPNQKLLEQTAIQSGEMRKCPYCSELIKREAIKCRYCGSEVESLPPLTKNISIPHVPPSPPVSAKTKIIRLLLIFGGITLFILIVYFLRK
ncbi:MAG: zinc ribbon domain-containing protein [Bacteroidota bacterium]